MPVPVASSRAARSAVAQRLERAPVIGVVRHASAAAAERQAREWMGSKLELLEITFTVPGASALTRALLAERPPNAPPSIGMGTVTGAERARAAVAAGAEFLVSPNASPEVAAVAREAGVFLILGALTPTEIVAARDLGADLVKVYPLPPVGGAGYLATVRQPLGDVPMLAAGGFGVEEIPAYRAAGARAFGIGPPLVGDSPAATRALVERALVLARGEGR